LVNPAVSMARLVDVATGGGRSSATAELLTRKRQPLWDGLATP
jgi:hypothetical protein